jgi:hypothetical protein
MTWAFDFLNKKEQKPGQKSKSPENNLENQNQNQKNGPRIPSITGIGCKRLRSIKFKAPAISSEPQIVLVSVNEGILSTNTFFFLD